MLAHCLFKMTYSICNIPQSLICRIKFKRKNHVPMNHGSFFLRTQLFYCVIFKRPFISGVLFLGVVIPFGVHQIIVGDFLIHLLGFIRFNHFYEFGRCASP